MTRMHTHQGETIGGHSKKTDQVKQKGHTCRKLGLGLPASRPVKNQLLCLNPIVSGVLA